MTNTLQADLAINPMDLDDAIIRQPGLFAHYAEMKAQAEKRLRLFELQIKVFEAALYQKFRDLALAKGEKLTERQVDVQIQSHPDWQARATQKIEMEAAVEQLDGIVKALIHKRDMIVTFASNLRAERSSSFAIRDGKVEDSRIPTGPVTLNG